MLGLKRTRSSDPTGELRRVLGGVELPTIPAVVTAAIERISSPNCDLSEVAEIVGRDPGLSARLLSMVNSAAYAPRNPIVGVSQAVTMLGRNHLESVLISVAASRAVSAATVPGFDLPGFWTTAGWRAAAAAGLSARVDRPRRSENFTAALLQDIAMPLLVTHEPRYRAVLERWRAGEGDLTDLEAQTFGWTHVAVGGWLFEGWGFPETLIEAITDTGSPEAGDARYPVVRVVSWLGRPGRRDALIVEVSERANAVFGIPVEDVTELLDRSHVEGTQLARSLS